MPPCPGGEGGASLVAGRILVSLVIWNCDRKAPELAQECDLVLFEPTMRLQGLSAKGIQ